MVGTQPWERCGHSGLLLSSEGSVTGSAPRKYYRGIRLNSSILLFVFVYLLAAD